jgi:hypothetical protein
MRTFDIALEQLKRKRRAREVRWRAVYACEVKQPRYPEGYAQRMIDEISERRRIEEANALKKRKPFRVTDWPRFIKRSGDDLRLSWTVDGLCRVRIMDLNKCQSVEQDGSSV